MDRVVDSYSLSPLQQGMLFHNQYDRDSGVDIQQMICALDEELNVPLFHRAWQKVVERHAVLRTSFRWEGLTEPLQEVHRDVGLPLEQQDWRDLPAPERERQLQAYLEADRRRGFDLGQAPLMRLALFRLAEADYRLVWTSHHAVLDGRSRPIVVREVFAYYEAYCEGRDVQLEEPRPYRDYIAWLGRQDLSRAEEFWRRALQGFAAPTPLVVANPPRQLSDDEKGHGLQEIRLSAATTSALRSLARQHDLTLNTLVQGAWALLLSRYSGEEDVVFGATRACRRSGVEGAESMVGLLINTLPVRVRLSPEMLLLPWLKELRAAQVLLRAYEHSPLVKVQEWSDVPRGTPLFDSILVFENYQFNTLLRAQGGDWQNRSFRILTQTNYPLTLTAYAGSELLLGIDYDRRYFDDSAITRMLAHLATLLEGVAANPDQRLSTLPLLTEAERHELLVEWSETDANYPRDKCIHELFEAQVERTPEAVAVEFGGQRLTYGELNRRANQLAHHLRGLGVGPEVLVGLCVERSLEMVVGLLGILKAGGAYVPLDPAYPRQRLAFMLEDTAARVVLTQESLAEGLPEAGFERVRLDADWPQIERESGENLLGQVTPENLAYVIYTSGSTGTPKGVSIRHRSVVRLVRETDYATFGPEEVFLQFAPISFDASTFEVWGALLNGARLAVMPPGLPSLEELGAALKRYEVSTLWLTAGLFHQMVETQMESLRGVRQLLAGGDVLSVPHVEKVLRELPGCRLINGYGPTENTTFTCCHTVKRGEPLGASVPIGRPIANTRVFILDRNRQPVPIGVPGELYIGGDGVARDYFRRPELTAEKFVPSPFGGDGEKRLYGTGDRARYRADGTIEFLGRIDDQVKIRGFRIEPGEVEAVLAEHPAVREAVVVVRQDAPGNKRLAAYLVFEGEREPSLRELRSFLKQKLPEYMVPSAFVTMEALPLTPSGKLDRRALPVSEQTRPELDEKLVAPRTPVEEVLARIWAQVLGVGRVGIHDNFFELGGHSLLATQVISRVRLAFPVELSLRLFFEAPTVADLAIAITQRQAEKAEPEEMARLLAELEGDSRAETRSVPQRAAAPVMPGQR